MLLHQACLAQPDVLAGFLNRLFNTLNWTVTEFTVSLKARSPGPCFQRFGPDGVYAHGSLRRGKACTGPA